MTRQQRLLVALALAAFTMLPIAFFILSRDGDDNGKPSSATAARGCTDEERAFDGRLAAKPTPTPLGPNLDFEQMNKDSQAAAEPRFLDKVCGIQFVANEDEARPGELCNGQFQIPAATPIPSELNKPDMTEQLICKTGQVIATFSPTGRKAYFTGTPKVSYAANRDHIRTLEIDGKSGIIVIPGMQLGPHFFAIVQRWPEGDKPGILLAGGAFTSGYNEAIAQARKALAE